MKFSTTLRKFAPKAAVAAAVGATGAASAAADYSSIITSADWSTAAVGVVAIGAALALVNVAKTGVRKVISMISG